MTVHYLGELTVGAFIPALGPLTTTIVAELQAKLAALVALAASLTVTPPSLNASLNIATGLVANLEASISAGLPGVDFQVAAVAALLADINAKLLALLAFPIATAGLHLFVYEGPIGRAGTEIQGALANGIPGQGLPNAEAHALVLATTSSVSWTALGLVVKTS